MNRFNETNEREVTQITLNRIADKIKEGLIKGENNYTKQDGTKVHILWTLVITRWESKP